MGAAPKNGNMLHEFVIKWQNIKAVQYGETMAEPQPSVDDSLTITLYKQAWIFLSLAVGMPPVQREPFARRG
jgi:hypothetical protein